MKRQRTGSQALASNLSASMSTRYGMSAEENVTNNLGYSPTHQLLSTSSTAAGLAVAGSTTGLPEVPFMFDEQRPRSLKIRILQATEYDRQLARNRRIARDLEKQECKLLDNKRKAEMMDLMAAPLRRTEDVNTGSGRRKGQPHPQPSHAAQNQHVGDSSATASVVVRAGRREGVEERATFALSATGAAAAERRAGGDAVLAPAALAGGAAVTRRGDCTLDTASTQEEGQGDAGAAGAGGRRMRSGDKPRVVKCEMEGNVATVKVDLDLYSCADKLLGSLERLLPGYMRDEMPVVYRDDYEDDMLVNDMTPWHHFQTSCQKLMILLPDT